MGAMEAAKLIAGLGKPLANRLLVYDLRDFSFQTIDVCQDPQCASCGELSDV